MTTATAGLPLTDPLCVKGVNLIPTALRRQAARRRRLVRWTVALAAASGLAAIAFGAALRAAGQASALATQARALQADRLTATTKLAEATRESRRLSGEIQRADALRSKRSWAGLLRLLAEAMPAEVWLIALATDPPLPAASGLAGGATPVAWPAVAGPGTTPAAPITMTAPTAISLSGYALDQDRLFVFMTALKQSGVFSRVELVKAGSEPVGETSAVRFQLACAWP